MSESTLACTLESLQALVSWKLGSGRSYSTATAGQQANVDAAIKSGLREFYWPSNGMDWTFLWYTGNIGTAIGVRDYQLPDDFASPEGEITWNESTGPAWVIKRLEVDEIRRMRQGLTMANGRPAYFALICSKPIGAIGTRWTVEFERGFNSTYTLQYRYRLLPNTLTAGQVPYGGAQHAETIIAACLAAAEWQINGQRGVEYATFNDRLQASIAADSRLRTARTGPYGQDGAGAGAWGGGFGDNRFGYGYRDHIDLIYGSTNLDL